MQREQDAKELFSLIHTMSLGSGSKIAGIYGPIGVDRGVWEQLLKQTGIICGKIIGLNLSRTDIDQYFAICQTSVATGVMAESDLEKVQLILDRSIQNGPDL